MILVDYQIREEIETGRIVVSPFEESLLNPSSLDIRLGNKFGVVVANYEHIDPLDPYSFSTKEIEADNYILPAGGFVLGTLVEHISLPADISATCRGKSSLARLGIDNSSFGMHVDCGFSGVLVVEIANHSTNSIILTAGMKIGQLLFYKHEAAETPYGEKKSSRYQSQTGLQGSKGI